MCLILFSFLSLPPPSSQSLVDRWDADFVDNLDQTTLFRLIVSANYLAILPLVQLISAKFATMIKSKAPHAIKATFGIPDFSPDEVQEMKEKFPDLLE